MSLQLLRNRRQIEKLYHGLEMVRANMKSLILDNIENLTAENMTQLEKEEEKLLNRIVMLKSILNKNHQIQEI